MAAGAMKREPIKPAIRPVQDKVVGIRRFLIRAAVKIDKVSRIVLPKSARDRFQLWEGSELKERLDGLTPKPVEQRPSMLRKDGI